MRITKKGTRNLQDWNDADHAAAGHAFVAEPLPLAMCNIRSSLANLEVAADALGKLNWGIPRGDVQDAITALNRALEALGEPKGQVAQ